jgi:phosphotransferase system enzyme I (PtsI)
MGLRQFSMHPSQILPVKERLFELSTKDAVRLAGRVLRESDPLKIRAALDHRRSGPPEAPASASVRSAA